MVSPLAHVYVHGVPAHMVYMMNLSKPCVRARARVCARSGAFLCVVCGRQEEGSGGGFLHFGGSHGAEKAANARRGIATVRTAQPGIGQTNLETAKLANNRDGQIARLA